MIELDIVERLRGKVRVPVNDGAGLLDGKDFFERSFPTSKAAIEAADEIERLRQEVSRLSEQTVEWYPIATAPRPDSLIILGWRTEDGLDLVGEGYWDEGCEDSYPDAPAYPAGWCIPSLGYFNVDMPTHWTHLPSFRPVERQKDSGDDQ